MISDYNMIHKMKQKIQNMRFSFQFYWMSYFIAIAVAMGLILAYIDNILYIDGLFFATAAVSASGLSTLSMSSVSRSNIVLFQFVMMFGQTTVTLLAILLYRIRCFQSIEKKIMIARENNEIPAHDELTDSEKTVIDEEYLVYHAMVLLSKTIFYYIITIHVIGIILLYLALTLQPNLPELVSRGYSRLDNAVFLAISGYSNTGFTIASDSLIGIANNPSAYIILSILILLGNTMYPIVCRKIIKLIARHTPSLITRQHAQYILDHPNKIANLLYSAGDTRLLLYSAIVLNMIQYITYLALTLNRKSTLEKHDIATLAGIGYFQTISTRAAGFSILDLHSLNQGVIFIYGVMCYINANRLISIIREYHADLMIKSGKKPSSKRDSAISGVQLLEITRNPMISDNTGISKRSSTYSLLDDQDKNQHNRKNENQVGDIDDDVLIVSKGAYYRFLFTHTNFLFLAIVILAATEDRILTDPHTDINLWYVVFELLSGYGGVGLSIGTPGQSYSLSGMYSPLGKVVMILVMLLGRHRGIPRSTDEFMDFKFTKLIKASRYDARIHEMKAISPEVESPLYVFRTIDEDNMQSSIDDNIEEQKATE